MKKISPPDARTRSLLVRQMLLGLLFTSIASALFVSNSFLKGLDYHDNLRFFSFFRNNLHSLNYFGKIAWWDPSTQMGFPMFYPSIFSTNSLSPLFVALGGVVWILGRVGIVITKYHSLYLVYYGFLIPYLFMVSVVLFARQMLKENRAIIYVIIVAAFSAGVIANLSDNGGLEQTAYGLLVASSFLRFARDPSRRTFWWFALTTLMMAISVTYLFLFWNVLFVPLIILLYLAFSGKGKDGLRSLFTSVPLSHWALLLTFAVVCALPAGLTLSHGKEIMRQTIGKQVYAYDTLRAGNPLEFLTASTPGVGFEWDGGYLSPNATWGLRNYGHFAYTYIGFLALPLAFLGYVSGRRPWRHLLLWLTIIMAMIVTLASYSPIFTAILYWDTPLRSVNHYSDAVYREGGFLLLIVAAGLGFEAFLTSTRALRKLFMTAFFASAAFSLFIFWLMYGRQLTTNYLFGLMLGLIFFVPVVLLGMKNGAHLPKNRALVWLLMGLIFIDVSSVSFRHVRKLIWEKSQACTEPGASVIGMKGHPGNTYMEDLLILKSMKDLRDFGRGYNIPRFGVYEPPLRMPAGTSAPPDALLFPDYEQWKGPGERVGSLLAYRPVPAQIRLETRDYSTLRVSITSEKAGLLFYPDAYFPLWRAKVNGTESAVRREMHAFKSVAVPQGTSVVEFSFVPGGIPWVIALSYLGIVGALLMFLRMQLFRPTKLLSQASEA